MRLIPSLVAATAALTALTALTAVSCSKAKEAKPAEAAQPDAKAPLEGTVLEAIPASPYTYFRLKTATGEVWAAVPAADIKVGSTIKVLVQLKMDNFESPSLHRKFDAVYMGTLPGSGPAGPSAGTPPAGMPATAMPAAPAGPVVPDEKVAKATGPNARTIAELYAGSKDLAGKAAVIQGKVVKYNEGILGKNWVHLRDGSGSAPSKDNDVTVTTLDKVKVGDIITVKGTVRLDKDLGMGYKYPVLLEDAKVSH